MWINGLPAIWLIPALPALGALLIFIFAGSMHARTAGVIATFAVACSFVWTLFESFSLLSGKLDFINQTHWNWLDVDFIRANVAFLFDRVSMIFALVISGVGFLIHLYSTSYMHGDEGQRRYFGYLSLFVASMLVLVLADNGFFMLVGWEGVGACSFALIGHYYYDQKNVGAALKAFYVTRLGDVFLVLGLLLCAMIATVHFTELSRFSALHMNERHAFLGVSNSTLILVAGLLLLGGAAGKSAQLPLQTWLPDAMAGPTPVSALIHAATMVTAGVYLILRFHELFAMSHSLMLIVAIVGCTTAFYGATCAMFQSDIKRILAFSTISQIGYMILALGVGAWSLALFHFFTHAFFKALLFLSAGSIIHSLHGEQNIYNMGGLRKTLPKVYYCMLAGAAALAGIPLTSGFFSKDAILFSTLTLPHGNVILYAVGLLTAFLTAIYSFRMIYLTFHGAPRKEFHVHLPDAPQLIPLFVLAFFALFAGFLNIPGIASWEHFINPGLGESLAEGHSMNAEWIAAAASAVLAIIGWLIARTLYSPRRIDAGVYFPALAMAPSEVEIESPAPYKSSVVNFLYRAWNFDSLYNLLWVTPYRLLTEALSWIDEHIIDGLYEALAVIFQLFHGFFVTLQNGRIGRYAGFMLFGAVAVSIIIFLFVPGIL